MGIVSFSDHFSRMPVLSVLLAPLHTLAALFVPTNRASSSTLAHPAAKIPCSAADAPFKVKVEQAKHSGIASPNTCQSPAKSTRTSHFSKTPVSRLKIVREFDPGIGRACAGRMTISGRMADVCAELDRMEQRERLTCHR